MVIHLNENRFVRLFLTESKNSERAHRQTRMVLADFFRKPIDDPSIIQKEQEFERDTFGEGKRVDWFVTLEPYACKWFLFGDPSAMPNFDGIIDEIFIMAQTAENRTIFMQQIKSMENFNDVVNFISKLKKQEKNSTNTLKKEYKRNTNYQILGPLTFQEAKKYGLESGGGGLKICYTQNPKTWIKPQFSNNNVNKLFLLLRNDWQTVNPEHDGSEVNNGIEGLNIPIFKDKKKTIPYSGYDDYGLSMIFVWITPEGELHESNTRWNHHATYPLGHMVDHPFTKEEIEQLIGTPFENIFNITNR